MMRQRWLLTLICLALAGPPLARADDASSALAPAPAFASAPVQPGASGAALAPAAPALMLAKVYRPGIKLNDYWVSEKYDSVRGYWDGEKLWTRGGERVNAPAWFTAGWPRTPMDGELWAGRGQFSKAVSTVRQQAPNDEAWRTMRFMVFDLPAQGGIFSERIPALKVVVSRIKQSWVQAVLQSRVETDAELQRLLEKNVSDGGEGLMLHRGASLYQRPAQR